MRHNVVARYLFSKAIADVTGDLVKFKMDVDIYTRHEDFAKQEIVKLQGFIDAMKRLDYAVSKPLATELGQTDRNRYEIKGEFQAGYKYQKLRATGQMLFLAILQSYVLPTQLRKTIEGAARFWTKAKLSVRIKSQKHSYDADLEYMEKYLLVCLEFRKQVGAAEAAIAKGRLNSDPELAEQVKYPAGSFTLINTGGFDNKVMEKAVDIVTKAEAAMRSIGLGKVCYGDIHISQTVNNKKNVAAFYLPSADEMFVRANTPDNWDTVRVVCHELAHRLQNKFLTGRSAMINDMYRQLRHSSEAPPIPSELYPRVGDQTEYKGKMLTVSKVEVSRRKAVVQWVEEGDATHRFSAPLETWLKIKKLPVPKADPDRSFVTGYAGTHPDENFAEMVSFLAIGKLSAPLKAMLDPILS